MERQSWRPHPPAGKGGEVITRIDFSGQLVSYGLNQKIEQLLKERDEAIKRRDELEGERDSYLKVANKFISACKNYYSINELHEAMDLAQRILKEKKEKK
jgi:hypothetical protein